MFKLPTFFVPSYDSAKLMHNGRRHIQYTFKFIPWNFDESKKYLRVECGKHILFNTPKDAPLILKNKQSWNDFNMMPQWRLHYVCGETDIIVVTDALDDNVYAINIENNSVKSPKIGGISTIHESKTTNNQFIFNNKTNSKYTAVFKQSFSSFN